MWTTGGHVLYKQATFQASVIHLLSPTQMMRGDDLMWTGLLEVGVSVGYMHQHAYMTNKMHNHQSFAHLINQDFN